MDKSDNQTTEHTVAWFYRPAAPVCSCCSRTVRRVRGSMWHGSDQICMACFYVWYDDGITDKAEIGREIIRREAANEWPFPDAELERVL